MLTFRDYVLMIGAGLFSLGLLCLPIGRGANPKRDLSAFANLADLGAFLSVGAGLIAVGAAIVLLALLTPYAAAACRRLKQRFS